jgi:hypothetical protein
MKKTLTLVLLLPFIGFAQSSKPEKNNGFIEYQSKTVQNKEETTNEDWNSEQIQQMIISGGVSFNLWKHKIEANALIQYYQSPVFGKQLNPTKYVVIPPKVIARNFFKSNHEKREDDSVTQATFNHFIYSWEDADIKINAGRIPILYGHGQSLNPINPFNFNSALSNNYGVNQGNDGVEVILKKDPKLKLHLYLLADKSFTDYDERVTKTLVLRGEWKVDNITEINYIFGEDQKRHKYGAEIKRNFLNSFAYLQGVRYSQRLDKNDASSQGLFHYILGYELDLTQTWTSRLEIGKFENDQEDTESVSQNFLPFENFSSILNLFRINDEITTELSLSSDMGSQASFYKISIAYHNLKNLEFRLFSSGLSSEPKDDPDYAGQDLIPTDFGLAVRYNF